MVCNTKHKHNRQLEGLAHGVQCASLLSLRPPVWREIGLIKQALMMVYKEAVYAW